jgi:6-pyruvoyltetrahydropterin/6-carboxytetrahydropterin synthase
MFRVTKESMFSASHHLRNYKGKCERVHGHNWKVSVTACGRTLTEGGLLVDFKELKRALDEVLERLDHEDLNAVEPFTTLEPSAEHIARYICTEIATLIDSPTVTVCEVAVWETPTSMAVYIREDDTP